MNIVPTAKVYLTGPQVKQRYGCSYQTIWRWMRNPELGFPEPLKINNRNRFALDAIEAFERKEMLKAKSA
jgi:predicted DNA-binding transcriptional regulator AlpA